MMTIGKRPSLLIVVALSCWPAARSLPSKLQTAGEITFSYSLASAQVTLHQPVILNFLLKNRSGQPIQLDLGKDRKENFLLEVTRPNGTTVSLLPRRKEGLGRMGLISVEAGREYRQELLLNEWIEFEVPGKYEVEVRLAKPVQTERGIATGGAAPFHTTLEILPRDEIALAEACDNLTFHIDASTSYEAASEAALALSYVKDPIAVPYLKRALLGGHLVEPIAIAGLERIADYPAVEVLISVLEIKRADVSVMARAALQRIEQRTSNPTLAARIRHALRSS